MKHEKSIAISCSQKKIVHNKQRYYAIFPSILLNEVHDDKLMFQIKRTRRLIKQKNLWAGNNRLRHKNKLFLPSAKTAYLLLTQFSKAQLVDNVHNSLNLVETYFYSQLLNQSKENHFKDCQSARYRFQLWNVCYVTGGKEGRRAI